MTQVALSNPALADIIYEGEKPEVLNGIWAAECGAALYHRQLGALLQAWLNELSPEKLPKARLSLRPDQISAALQSVCTSHDIADDPCCQILINDICSLAQFFARVMKTDRITLRLDVVDGDACRKFHQDNVSARLLCTYRGRGTEYGKCTTRSEPDVIQQLPLGSAGIFKGRQWPAAPPSGIYHRSPQIAGSGETRLLLVIDAASFDEECNCC